MSDPEARAIFNRNIREITGNAVLELNADAGVFAPRASVDPLAKPTIGSRRDDENTAPTPRVRQSAGSDLPDKAEKAAFTFPVMDAVSVDGNAGSEQPRREPSVLNPVPRKPSPAVSVTKMNTSPWSTFTPVVPPTASLKSFVKESIPENNTSQRASTTRDSKSIGKQADAAKSSNLKISPAFTLDAMGKQAELVSERQKYAKHLVPLNAPSAVQATRVAGPFEDPLKGLRPSANTKQAPLQTLFPSFNTNQGPLQTLRFSSGVKQIPSRAVSDESINVKESQVLADIIEGRKVAKPIPTVTPTKGETIPTKSTATSGVSDNLKVVKAIPATTPTSSDVEPAKNRAVGDIVDITRSAPGTTVVQTETDRSNNTTVQNLVARMAQLESANVKLQKTVLDLQEESERRRWLGTVVAMEPFDIKVKFDENVLKVQVQNDMQVGELIRRIYTKLGIERRLIAKPRIIFGGAALGHLQFLGESGVNCCSEVSFDYEKKAV